MEASEMPPLARDLLARMLEYDPERRITATQALQHPYLAGDRPYPRQSVSLSVFYSSLRFSFAFDAVQWIEYSPCIRDACPRRSQQQTESCGMTLMSIKLPRGQERMKRSRENEGDQEGMNEDEEGMKEIKRE